MTMGRNLRIYLYFVFVALFILSGSAQAGNDDVNGWGKFTWGMTVEEVKAIDPQWEDDTGLQQGKWKGYRLLAKKIKLFNQDTILALFLKKGKGLEVVKLSFISSGDNPTTYPKGKDLVLKIFNALKAKYGKGSSIEYKYSKEEIVNFPDINLYSIEGSLYIEHIWRLTETIIEYDSSAFGRNAPPPYGSTFSSFSISITYSASGTSDYEKL